MLSLRHSLRARCIDGSRHGRVNQRHGPTTCTLLQDWDLLELEHGCIVDRNACIFCHVGIFRNGTFIIDQVRLPARPCPALPLHAACTDASSTDRLWRVTGPLSVAYLMRGIKHSSEQGEVSGML